jgi:hypothetical protein
MLLAFIAAYRKRWNVCAQRGKFSMSWIITKTDQGTTQHKRMIAKRVVTAPKVMP